MAGLTTHILDLTHGAPADGVKIVLSVRNGGGAEKLKEAVTNADGRCDAPLIAANDMKKGGYLLEFHIGDYFRRKGIRLDDPAFLDIIPIAFAVSDIAAHYHVPLLVSPYGYSTYRGS
jgi:5-hydroxyisourate hydrolase